MAEMAVAAFSAVGTAAASAGSFVSAATTVLQGVATVGSVLASVAQANQTKIAGQQAAQDALFQSELAQIEGDRLATQSAARALEIRRDALKKIGAARVAFGASGLDISSGQLAAVEGSLNDDASYNLALENDNKRIAIAEANLKSGQYKAQASNAIASAKSASTAQYIGAGVTGAKGLLSIVRRG